MNQALVLTNKGEFRDIDLEHDTLAALQEGVQGYVELVALSADLHMWVNEEGKLTDLPLNRFATSLYWAANPHASEAGDYIVGDVVLTGGSDDEGETQGLPDKKMELVKAWLRNQPIALQDIIE